MSAETGKDLTEKANAAFRQAAAKVVERARQTGTPVIVWENGQIVERSAEELETVHATASRAARATQEALPGVRAGSGFLRS